MPIRMLHRGAVRRSGRRHTAAVRHGRAKSRSNDSRSFGDQMLRARMTRAFWLVLALVCLPVVLTAQVDEPNTAVLLTGPNFFVTLVAGLILAIAFQLVLTNLSLAAGLNALGPIGKVDRPTGKDRDTKARDRDNTGVAGTVRKISSGFGLWSMITASIALFFASWLAVELSFTPSIMTGAVLGLVIWGLFYVTMMVIEGRLFSSLIGTLMKIATGGLRTAYNMTTSVFRKSDDEKLADTAARVTEAVRDELFSDVDTGDIKDEIRKYVKQMKPRKLDADSIRDEIVKLLDETEIRAVTHPGGEFNEETVLRFEHKGKFNAEQMQTISKGVRGAFQKIREETKSDKDTVAKVVDAALRVAGVSAEDASKYRKQVEDYMRRTGREELDPDTLKRDLETTFRDFKSGRGALTDRISKLDRSTVTSLLAQREGYTEEKAQQAVDRFYRVLNKVRGRSGGGDGEIVTEVTDMTSTGVPERERAHTETVRDRVTNKVRTYLDSLQVEPLSYDNVSQDFQQLFKSPKEGASSLVQRLKSLNRDDLRQIIASRRDIPPEEAERLINRMEDARDSVVDRYNRVVSDVRARTQSAKAEFVYQAEETRKTAASAAWWVLGAAVVSGIAAVVGGILGAVNEIGM